MGARVLRCVGVALVACASPAVTRVEMCPPLPERPALAAASCLEEPGARRHAALVASLVGEVLDGWHSHPGAADFSAAFGDDGRVASLCFDSVSGTEIARRILELAERARELAAAPSCLAGRRLDLAWESEAATSEEVRQAVRSCRQEVRWLKSGVDWCRFHQHCSVTEVAGLESEADRELRACVLESVPLRMRTGISREALAFLPARGSKPDPELALRAHRVCDGLPRPADVIECMERHGWQRAPAR